MPTVKIKVVTEDEKKLARQIDLDNKKIDKLERKLANTGKTGKKAFKSIGDELNSFAMRVAAPTFAITKIIETVRELYRETRRLNKEAVTKGVTTGQARAQAIFNLSDFEGGGKKGAASLDRMVKNTQRKIGGTLADIYSDAALMLSRREGQDKEVVKTALETSAQMRLTTGGRVQGGEVASAALSLPKVTGSKDAATNVGRLLQLTSAVPSSNPADVMNVLPAYVALVTEMKMKEERALEFIAAVANQIKDRDFSKTATGVAAFFASVDTKKIYPITKTDTKTGKTKTTLGMVPGNDIYEKLYNVRKGFQNTDPETQGKILKSSGRGNLFKMAFVRPFLSESETIKKQFKSVEKQIDPFSEKAAKEKWETTIQAIYSGKFGKRLKADIDSGGVNEQLLSGRTGTASSIEEQSRTAYEKALEGAGVNYLKRSVSEFDLTMSSLFGGSPTEDLLKKARATKRSLAGIPQGANVDKIMADTFKSQPEAFNKFITLLEQNQKELEAIRVAAENNANSSATTAQNTVQSADPNSQEIQ